MSNTIKLKRSSQPSKVPLATDLTDGEIAINSADGKIYYRNSSGNISEIKSSEVTNGVYTVGDQAINGVKTFLDPVGLGTSSPTEKLDVRGNVAVEGDVKFATAENGVILKSPNGTLYKLTVNDDGSLQTTIVPDEGFVFVFTSDNRQLFDQDDNAVQIPEEFANS